MTNVLAISGSLRRQSSNTRLLNAIVKLADPDLNMTVFSGLDQLPYFNPDLDNDSGCEAVTAWRSQLLSADAVLFCTPEYAHGIPGVLKNALDWIVSSGEFMHKPTAVISASPSPDGGNKANAALVQTLTVMMAAIAPQATLCIPAVSVKVSPSCDITDPDTVQAVTSLLGALVTGTGHNTAIE